MMNDADAHFVRVEVASGYTYSAPSDVKVGDRVVVGRQGFWPGAPYEEYETVVTKIGSTYDGPTRKIVRVSNRIEVE